MAILERDNENWNALTALVERVGTANVLYAIASINREQISVAVNNTGTASGQESLSRLVKTSGIVENAANAAARHCPFRTRQVA